MFNLFTRNNIFTYVHTILNNFEVRCCLTLVTARKDYMRLWERIDLDSSHWNLQSIYNVLHSIVSLAVYILWLEDCFLDYRYYYASWQIWKIGRFQNFFISNIKPKVETLRVKYLSVFELGLFTSFWPRWLYLSSLHCLGFSKFVSWQTVSPRTETVKSPTTAMFGRKEVSNSSPIERAPDSFSSVKTIWLLDFISIIPLCYCFQNMVMAPGVAP